MLTMKQIADGISVVAQEYPIKKAELFGSYANGTNHAESDVDLLMEFHSPRVSLLTLNSIKYRLEDILQTDVDIVHGPLREDSMLEINRRVSVYGA